MGAGGEDFRDHVWTGPVEDQLINCVGPDTHLQTQTIFSSSVLFLV